MVSVSLIFFAFQNDAQKGGVGAWICVLSAAGE